MQIKSSTSTYQIDTADCDAESDSVIILARSCTIPVSTLRTEPFNLADFDSVNAIVTAINAIGSSLTSSEGGGAIIPETGQDPDLCEVTLNDLSSYVSQIEEPILLDSVLDSAKLATASYSDVYDLAQQAFLLD